MVFLWNTVWNWGNFVTGDGRTFEHHEVAVLEDISSDATVMVVLWNTVWNWGNYVTGDG
jgi:hypothetical protein